MILSQIKILKVYYVVGVLGNGLQVDLLKLNIDFWVSFLVQLEKNSVSCLVIKIDNKKGLCVMREKQGQLCGVLIGLVVKL